MSAIEELTDNLDERRDNTIRILQHNIDILDRKRDNPYSYRVPGTVLMAFNVSIEDVQSALYTMDGWSIGINENIISFLQTRPKKHDGEYAWSEKAYIKKVIEICSSIESFGAIDSSLAVGEIAYGDAHQQTQTALQDITELKQSCWNFFFNYANEEFLTRGLSQFTNIVGILNEVKLMADSSEYEVADANNCYIH